MKKVGNKTLKVVGLVTSVLLLLTICTPIITADSPPSGRVVEILRRIIELERMALKLKKELNSINTWNPLNYWKHKRICDEINRICNQIEWLRDILGDLMEPTTSQPVKPE